MASSIIHCFLPPDFAEENRIKLLCAKCIPPKFFDIEFYEAIYNYQWQIISQTYILDHYQMIVSKFDTKIISLRDCVMRHVLTIQRPIWLNIENTNETLNKINTLITYI